MPVKTDSSRASHQNHQRNTADDPSNLKRGPAQSILNSETEVTVSPGMKLDQYHRDLGAQLNQSRVRDVLSHPWESPQSKLIDCLYLSFAIRKQALSTNN
jgi:hypothetical protein